MSYAVIHYCQHPECSNEVREPGYCSAECKRDHITWLARHRGQIKPPANGVYVDGPRFNRRNGTDNRQAG